MTKNKTHIHTRQTVAFRSCYYSEGLTSGKFSSLIQVITQWNWRAEGGQCVLPFRGCAVAFPFPLPSSVHFYPRKLSLLSRCIHRRWADGTAPVCCLPCGRKNCWPAHSQFTKQDFPFWKVSIFCRRWKVHVNYLKLLCEAVFNID